MKIESIDIKPYTRKFIRPLETSKGIIAERRGNIIRVIADNGRAEFGESAPWPDYPPAYDSETFAGLIDTLIGASIPDMIGEIACLAAKLPYGPDRHAVETALCALAASGENKNLSRWLIKSPSPEVPVNYLLDRPVENWPELAESISRAGYSAVKIKVGGRSITEDAAFVEQARMRFGNTISIRLDANCGWEYQEASDAMRLMKPAGIEYIEEPLAAPDVDSLIRLKNEIGIPIALDESLPSFDDIESVLATDACHVIVLKPAVVGGIYETIRLVDLAAGYGKKAVITSTMETEVGIAASLHLAAAVHDRLLPCGLDTLRLFTSGGSSLSAVHDGAIRVPQEAGLGVSQDLWGGL